MTVSAELEPSRRDTTLLRQRFRSGRRYIEDVHWQWVSEISQYTIDQLEEVASRKSWHNESFSSIDSVNTREKFVLAVANIRRGIYLIEVGGPCALSLLLTVTDQLTLIPGFPSVVIHNR
ncbi:hypothetical protein Q1695_003383 [Nippostrongylus brasiliensis]|nr:hypothetical protein Q1695_003383 [Nippostrongylus brasiliensis]